MTEQQDIHYNLDEKTMIDNHISSNDANSSALIPEPILNANNNDEIAEMTEESFKNSQINAAAIQYLQMKYIDMIKKIDNAVIRTLYSKFLFKCYKFNKEQNNHTDKAAISITELIKYLKNHKLIVYHLCNLVKRGSAIKVDFNISKGTDCILCIENECIILEQTNIEMINEIINKLKSLKISIINVSKYAQLPIEMQSKEEIQNFCEKYIQTIKNNYFVEYTIYSIVGYMIRRYYYPDHYFIDPSFFYFDKINEINNNEIRNAQNEFQKNEFVYLRTLYANSKNSYSLMIHIKTFYLFVIKNYDELTMKHEIQFCNYSLNFFTRFYGFQKQGKTITGLIYEFMSNGSLDSFIKNNETDEMYSMMIVLRLCFGVGSLRSYFLLHRDLKPSNILVDHNYFTYISDFETIRSANLSEESFTKDIGSQLYSSPEQDRGDILSFSTDIYSFGLIIYFLFEKTHMHSSYSKELIKPMTKGPFIIRYIYEQCVQYNQENRINIDEINAIIGFIFTRFRNYYDYYLIYGNNKFLLEAKKYYKESFKYNDSYIFYELGDFYASAFNAEKDYMKSINFYEKSAKLNNSKANLKLGDFYKNGLGVEKDYLKAKEFYEKSAKLDNSMGFLILGDFYKNGLGVEKDFKQAKKYYEKSAEFDNSYAFLNLGFLYENGYGVEKNYLKAKEHY